MCTELYIKLAATCVIEILHTSKLSKGAVCGIYRRSSEGMLELEAKA